MKKILVVFGTRPEAIKMAPIIKEFKSNPSLGCLVCVFRQHGAMLDHMLKVFEIRPDFDLKVMLSDKALFGKGVGWIKKGFNLAITGLSLFKFLMILKKEKPDLIMVQGDTSTAFLVALLGFHYKIKIAHVEAGLRTFKKYSPFPEEMNRQLICKLADLHFAPTEQARANLLREGVDHGQIVVSGNTAIDALLMVKNNQKDFKKYEEIFRNKYGVEFDKNKKLIVLTAHRRESFGNELKNVFLAAKEIAGKRKDVMIIYPVHLNPNVYGLAHEILDGVENVQLIDPLEYDEMIFLMGKSYLILTDSGGIQEEAPSLGKPALVMRDDTERQEGVAAGASKLVGTDKDKIVKETITLLDSKADYQKMTNVKNPYGEGKSAKIIVETLINRL